jgi:hypothetical protein
VNISIFLKIQDCEGGVILYAGSSCIRVNTVGVCVYIYIYIQIQDDLHPSLQTYPRVSIHTGISKIWSFQQLNAIKYSQVTGHIKYGVTIKCFKGSLEILDWNSIPTWMIPWEDWTASTQELSEASVQGVELLVHSSLWLQLRWFFTTPGTAVSSLMPSNSCQQRDISIRRLSTTINNFMHHDSPTMQIQELNLQQEGTMCFLLLYDILWGFFKWNTFRNYSGWTRSCC